MKKFILLLIIVSLFLSINKKDMPVFNETLENKLYEITFSNNLSTKNFLDYFENARIIYIKPNMNILYADKLKKFDKYYFKDISNEKNINIFKKEYINYINELGYKTEVLKLQSSGIMIEKIKLYLNQEELSYIKMHLSSIKIENVY